MADLVSILIPNYNKAPYLRECLDSVSAQTYSNWECIVVDDHSTDDSWEILEEYAEIDQRFKIYRRPGLLPKGANSCRNFAFKIATGKFVQYLDSDDTIHEHKISIQIEYNLVDSEILTFSNWEFFGSENCNKFLERYKYSKPTFCSIELLVQLWTMQKFIPVFCFLIPRSLITHNWKNHLVKNQDGDFFFRILMNDIKVKFVENAFGFYRIPSETHITANKKFTGYRSDYMTLNSYEEILNVSQSEAAIFGLVNNYVHYIVRTIDHFPILAKLSSRRIFELDPQLNHVVLYKRFFILHKILGF